MDKQVEVDLLKIQIVAKIEGMKEGKSQDYRDGVDDACQVMGDATVEMNETLRGKIARG